MGPLAVAHGDRSDLPKCEATSAGEPEYQLHNIISLKIKMESHPDTQSHHHGQKHTIPWNDNAQNHGCQQ